MGADDMAQGQASRAQEIRRSRERYGRRELRSFGGDTPRRLTAAVTIEAEDGSYRHLFLGPDAGGLKLVDGEAGWIVITPESPLGRALLGKVCGDEISTGNGPARKTFTIVAVA